MIPAGLDEILSRLERNPISVINSSQICNYMFEYAIICNYLQLHVKSFILGRWDPSFVLPGRNFSM